MNKLIELSRNTKVVVPLVILLAVSIFGGGALINNQQKIARQNEQNPQETTQETQQVAVEQLPTTPEETEDTIETQPENSADTGATTDSEVTVEPWVANNPDGTVTITAKLDTTENGVCTTTINDTQFTAIANGGSCEFKNLSVPVDIETLKITFEADESQGSGSTDIL